MAFGEYEFDTPAIRFKDKEWRFWKDKTFFIFDGLCCSGTTPLAL